MRKKYFALALLLMPLVYIIVQSLGINLQKTINSPMAQAVNNKDVDFSVIDHYSEPTDVLSKPLGLSITAQNEIYVCDSGNGRVLKFSSDGKNLAEYKSPDKETFSYPVAALEDNGRVFIADLDRQKVIAMNGQGGLLFTIPNAQDKAKVGAIKPLALASDLKHNIYVSDSNGRRILEFSSEGNFVREFTAEKSDLWFVNAMVVDETEHHLYALDTAKKQVLVFDSGNGSMLQKISLNGQINSPKGMALDPAGQTIYIADALNSSIYKFNLSTNELSHVVMPELNGPTGIAIAGNTLIIADRNNNRIIAEPLGSQRG